MELVQAGEYDFSLLGQFFSPDEMGRLEGLEQKRRALTENGREVFLQCVETIKKEKSLSNASGGGIDEINLLLMQKRQAKNFTLWVWFQMVAYTVLWNTCSVFAT
jgi:hypothetical protein